MEVHVYHERLVVRTPYIPTVTCSSTVIRTMSVAEESRVYGYICQTSRLVFFSPMRQKDRSSQIRSYSLRRCSIYDGTGCDCCAPFEVGRPFRTGPVQ